MGRRRARVRGEAQPCSRGGSLEPLSQLSQLGQFGAGRPEGERSQSAGATEVASARVAELTTYHNLGYAVIFDGPRAARSQPASATMARAAGQPGWHSGRAGPPPREWRTPLASQARTADGSSTCAKRQASPRVQDPVWNFMHTPPPAWLSRGSLQSFERWPCLPQL